MSSLLATGADSWEIDRPVELLRLEKAVIGHGRPLIGPIDLPVRKGERLSVLGPNGGGKTTLVKALVGLLPLLSGRRVVGDGRKVRIGYVPQAHRADPVYPLSALQVVLMGRYGLIGAGRRVRASDREAAARELSRVGLGGLEGALFRALSGGQRQRVLLARALVGEPELLVLDEFTSELDPAATAGLLDEVSHLAADSGVSVVFVTHEIAAAATHATHLALVDSHRGMFETGPTQQLLTSEKMSALYNRPMRIEQQGDRTVVFVEAKRAAS